jgi:NAD(P)-dependent dehydrogenase (short-subunit alcohol dehydrogenase family)
VDGFSDSLRVELRPFGIDVVLVHPAGIVTEWNEIARTSLVDRSKDGVYAASAVKAAMAMESVDNPRLSSGPEVVARTIVKAATAKRPRARYATGKGASTVMATRRVLPDRAFDAILSRMYLE